ncbi:unnamed protein product [Discula destructiva]
MSSSPLLSHASLHGLLRNVLRLAVPIAALLTTYLYLYPLFLVCGFPLPTTTTTTTTTTPTTHNGNHFSAWLETIKVHLHGTAAHHDEQPTPPPALCVAPFRLLALGDPQLEGDTSIPNAYKSTSFPHLHAFFERLVSRSDDYPTLHASTKQAFHSLVDFYFDDIPDTLESIRKRIDLFGNDFYLAHMYRALRWWTVPTHVTVLGDLVGSQWISDAEFDRRGWRYWQRVFKGGERVPDDLAAEGIAGDLGTALYDEIWQRRILNVAGNHDIGYAGDLTTERLSRFERVYGKANYDLRFALPTPVLSSSPTDDDRLPPELRIVVLNDMNLDTPVLNTNLQDETYAFINNVINTAAAVERRGTFTVVLTHVPLYKDAGICVDKPFFSFYDDSTLREQNQLSADASKGVFEGIFGLSGDAGAAGGGRGRRGVVLNGHDHEGCDTYHFINQSAPLLTLVDESAKEGGDDSSADSKPDSDSDVSSDDVPQEPTREWRATTWRNATQQGTVGVPSLPGLREITVRSMMGGYGGNAGLLSAWFDEDAWEWRFEYDTCALGTQHLWWAVHVTDLIIMVLGLVYVLSAVTLVMGEKKPRQITRGVEVNGRANAAPQLDKKES